MNRFFTELAIGDGCVEYRLEHPFGTQFTLSHLAQTKTWFQQLDARTVVTTSASRKVFSHGGDLGLFAEADDYTLGEYAGLCVDVVAALHLQEQGPLLSVAAVSGEALGCGFELALAHDFIIAHPDAPFGFPEIKFGMFPGMGATSFLPRKLKEAATFDLILTGKTFTGSELHALGIVNKLDSRPEDAARRMAASLAAPDQFEVHRAVLRSVRRANPITRAELEASVTDWALLVGELADRQKRRMKAGSWAQRKAAVSQSAPRDWGVDESLPCPDQA